jgi:hypothetical protein
VIENPVIRERITFLETTRETDGELLRFEYVAPVVRSRASATLSGLKRGSLPG